MAHDTTYFVKQMLGDFILQNAQLAAQIEVQNERIETLMAENEKLKGQPHTLKFAPPSETESVG